VLENLKEGSSSAHIGVGDQKRNRHSNQGAAVLLEVLVGALVKDQDTLIEQSIALKRLARKK